ncbi:protein of unknown function [Pararobbsia alpina]
MLDRRCVEAIANGFIDLDALFAVIAGDADLDQLVGVQVNADFFDDRLGQPLGADQHDRFQGVRVGAQRGALRRGQIKGGHGSVWMKGREDRAKRVLSNKSDESGHFPVSVRRSNPISWQRIASIRAGFTTTSTIRTSSSRSAKAIAPARPTSSRKSTSTTS